MIDRNLGPLFGKPQPFNPTGKALADMSRERRNTSKEAALSIEPCAATLRAKVLAFIQESGGATDEQIQDALEMNPSTERPRRGELVEAGSVVDSGTTRKTRSGRWAVVWIAKESAA